MLIQTANINDCRALSEQLSHLCRVDGCYDLRDYHIMRDENDLTIDFTVTVQASDGLSQDELNSELKLAVINIAEEDLNGINISIN